MEYTFTKNEMESLPKVYMTTVTLNTGDESLMWGNSPEILKEMVNESEEEGDLCKNPDGYLPLTVLMKDGQFVGLTGNCWKYWDE